MPLIEFPENEFRGFVLCGAGKGWIMRLIRGAQQVPSAAGQQSSDSNTAALLAIANEMKADRTERKEVVDLEFTLPQRAAEVGLSCCDPAAFPSEDILRAFAAKAKHATKKNHLHVGQKGESFDSYATKDMRPEKGSETMFSSLRSVFEWSMVLVFFKVVHSGAAHMLFGLIHAIGWDHGWLVAKQYVALMRDRLVTCAAVGNTQEELSKVMSTRQVDLIQQAVVTSGPAQKKGKGKGKGKTARERDRDKYRNRKRPRTDDVPDHDATPPDPARRKRKGEGKGEKAEKA